MTNESALPLTALWQNEFNADNLIDYARASKDLSEYIRVLVKEGYRHLVVPSRGAVPFISAAAAAWRLDIRSLPTYDEASLVSSTPGDRTYLRHRHPLPIQTAVGRHPVSVDRPCSRPH